MNAVSISSSTWRLLFFAAIAAVVATGAWLRFASLADRPLHFDEGTNARILANRLETGTTSFNPVHNHGPLLSIAAERVARWRGESSWQSLTKPSLRLTVAICGLLLVLGALCLRPLSTPGAGVAAAAFVATSPLLVYYSRMFIHEVPFTLFGLVGLLALLAFLERPGLLFAGVLGVGVGLMASTRETVVISLFAWGVASLIWLRQTHREETIKELARHVWEVKVPFLVFAAGLSLALIVVHYSDLMRHPEGVLDFFRTFYVYAPVAGHEKSATYFLELLIWPKARAGLWWTEAGVLLVALYGYFRHPAGTCRVACRFIVHGGLLHLAVYSAIAYKTPWLAGLGWLHLCLAAGMGAVQLVRDARGRWKLPALALVIALLAWQGNQSHRAAFRLASDARNPYAYVPTSTDVERMASWLEDLALEHPELKEEPVAVVGSFYWPLPWYLRGFDRVGYWDALPPDAEGRPLLLLLVDGKELEGSHAMFPRGLRHEVPVTVAIRRDIWEADTAAP